MRPVFAICCTATILGGLYLYMESRHRPVPALYASEETASGVFSVELLIPFEAGADPFSFDQSTAPSVELIFRGDPILRVHEAVAANSLLVVEPVDGLVAGKNEFFLTANPANSDPNAYHGARFRVLRDGIPIAKRSLWSEPGGAVRGAIVVDIADSPGPSAHEPDGQKE